MFRSLLLSDLFHPWSSPGNTFITKMGKRKAAEAAEPEGKKICKETDSQLSLNVNSESGGGGGLVKDGKNIESYMAVKRRQAAAMQRPKVFLTVESMSPEHLADEKMETKPPLLYVRDLQYLLVFALTKGVNYKQPRWCHMLRRAKISAAVVIVLNDTSITDFQQNTDCFPFLQGTFSEWLRVAVTNPSQYFSTFSFDMYAVPMIGSQLKGFCEKHGNFSHRNGVQVVFPKPSKMPDSGYPPAADKPADRSQKEEGEEEAPAQTTCCRTELLLSVAQMVAEKYPVPEDPDPEQKYVGFVKTKETYAPVTSRSHLFAVDCEMCLTTTLQHELTRVSMTNEQNEVIYDELVKPYNPIIDYLTRYSGITKWMLDPVTKRVEDVQKEISELLPDDAILCGQSLGNDLCALKMFHPYVIDTSVIYNLSGCRHVKCSLKRLSYCFLGRVIQESMDGHNSAEDAKATMDLVQLKLQKSLAFGDAVMGANVAPYLPSYTSVSDSLAQACSRAEPAAARVSQNGVRNKRKRVMPDSAMPDDPSETVMHSLFDILNNVGVSACQVGGERLVSRYQEEPGLKCCQVDTDPEACSKAQELGKDCKFTWVEFCAFAHYLRQQQEQSQGKEEAEEEEEERLAKTDLKQRRKVLKSLDKHVKKLMEQLAENCLVTVVLTGRSSEQHHEHAAAFLHIT